ncbi:TetR/AcrR family transcriptional regulator [Nocardia spumae]|uniref:TetR/AcrR family transcriptional regulator n=1 Tax=Nocardia spumae TaxID=2887190 RepID=UPI001D14B5DF|nr:TetR/AcrR family transcriptional regulator [Nocardia spumae]
MGNREDLLAGAQRCLFDKGYDRTTVRDIATAAGVSMAAIGYHFGTKEALLGEALAQATREWGDDLAGAVANSPAAADHGAPRFEARWDAVIDSIAAHHGLWSATFDALARPDIRRRLADNLGEARTGLAHLLEDIDEPDTAVSGRATAPSSDADAVGALCQVLLTGLAAHQLIDAQSTPRGRDLARAIRFLAARIDSENEPE